MRSLALLSCLGLTACLPTLHNARVEPGFRLDAGFTLLDDQPRGGRAQGADGLLTVAPIYGFGERVEIGLPIGVYWEEGLGASGTSTGSEVQQLVAMPYLKLALLPRGGRDHLALIGQAAAILPASVGLRYGRDLGRWEPHVGVSWIFSGGPEGDSPVVTRYQQREQRLIVGSVGASLFTAGRPVLEVGVLRNSYIDHFCDGTSMFEVRCTFYDLFVGVRVGTSR